MKNTGNLLAALAVAFVLAFLIIATYFISKPTPLEVQGEVDATQVKVGSKIAGRIDSIAVHKGDEVKKGDLLFVINSPELEAKLEQAKAGLEAARSQQLKANNGAEKEDIQAAYDNYVKAKAATELAKKTFERIANLYQDGVVPAQKKDEAETNYKAAIETENMAKALWEKAKKGTRYEDKRAALSMVNKALAMLKEVESFMNETKIYAPISGEISNIIAERGELVGAGYPVVTIVNLDDCWVTFNMREDLLSKIQKGSVFKARFPALNNKEIKLKVTYIAPLGNFATWNATKTSGDFDMKTFEVHARPIEKVDGLRPGMSALVNWKEVGTEK